ncbi:hypothetical protein SVAN01_03098 [Stagonosporopsis vannaccii]|nr:hypothetical protein SVAN01_03098 [Stagonosporopsis vannaccii]
MGPRGHALCDHAQFENANASSEWSSAKGPQLLRPLAGQALHVIRCVGHRDSTNELRDAPRTPASRGPGQIAHAEDMEPDNGLCEAPTPPPSLVKNADHPVQSKKRNAIARDSSWRVGDVNFLERWGSNKCRNIICDQHCAFMAARGLSQHVADADAINEHRQLLNGLRFCGECDCVDGRKGTRVVKRYQTGKSWSANASSLLHLLEGRAGVDKRQEAGHEFDVINDKRRLTLGF